MRQKNAIRAWGAGFSLVELLLVIGLIATMAALAVPAINSVTRANALTQSGELVEDLAAFARQEASSKGRPFELRFIRVPVEGGQEGRWSAVQVWAGETADKPATPVGKAHSFPGNVEIVDEETYSPMTRIGSLPRGTLPAGSKHAGQEFFAVRFRGSGAMDMQVQRTDNFLTLADRHDSARPPHNFFTIQFNPVTGRTEGFRR